MGKETTTVSNLNMVVNEGIFYGVFVLPERDSLHII